MSGTVKLSALGPPASGATSAKLACAQTVGSTTTDGLNSIPIPGAVPAPVTTAGNATLTAANLFTGYVFRSGPTADFTDTLDTAANIIALLQNITPGYGFDFTIVNLTNYVQTIAAGTGVTFSLFSPQTSGIQPNNSVRWRATVTDITSGSQAVTIYRLMSSVI